MANGKSSSSPSQLTKADVNAKAFTAVRVDIQDFFGQGPKYIYYLPLSARSMIELETAQGTPEAASKLAERLSSTVVDEQSTPVMTADEWLELPLGHLMKIGKLLIRSMLGLEVGEEIMSAVDGETSETRAAGSASEHKPNGSDPDHPEVGVSKIPNVSSEVQA